MRNENDDSSDFLERLSMSRQNERRNEAMREAHTKERILYIQYYKQKKNHEQKRRKKTRKEKRKTKKTRQPVFNQCNHLRRATWEVSLAGGV
jgi:hypothetical protein